MMGDDDDDNGNFKLCVRATREYMYELTIVVRKNLRIRRRRYVATMLEIFIPIAVAIIVATINANGELGTLRLGTLKDVRKLGQNESSGIYSRGNEFHEHEFNAEVFRLCNNYGVNSPCIIGYVADDKTRAAIFENTTFITKYYKYIKVDDGSMMSPFVAFDDEASIEACLKEPESCEQLDNEVENLMIFRGAVIFESSIDDVEVIYKIRLMERYYNSLGHTLKTFRLSPVLFERSDSVLSYLHSGFLPLQFQIDRQILSYVSNALKDPYVDFSSDKCVCNVSIHEMPRQLTDLRAFDTDDDNHELDINNEDNRLSEFYEHNASQLFEDRTLLISIIFVFSFIFVIPSELRRVVTEKESGLKILLLVTGMTHRMDWIGNLITVFLVYLISITAASIILVIPFNATNGAVFEFVSPTVLWLMFLLHVLALATMTYFLTVFFDRPVLATMVSVITWMITFVAPIYHVDHYYADMNLWLKLVLCFHPSYALHIGLKMAVQIERSGKLMLIFMVARRIEADDMRIIYVFGMLLADIVVFMVVTIYLDRVLKQRIGIRKPWYYPFLPSEWGFGKSNKVSAAKTIKELHFADEPGYEPYPENQDASVIIMNLTKKFGKVKAVEKLKLKLFHGEIFALLGHNGSGKSTTLGLLSGYAAPSSGTATVYGHDIKTDMTQIQAITGMCPQSNSLYEDLSPMEHLLIFGRLRGLRGTEAVDECIELLDRLRLNEMSHLAARKLSKGDKRKLCLAIALIGNPQLIILDEPTGGMDYYSRRAVWDILLKIRSDHTIIFSTHFMDEAELLGDKIGILASGKMEVCGSHAFLRRYFGFGYSLKMKVDPNTEPEPAKILEVVRGSMPNATLSTLPISPNANRVCCVNLPVEGYSATTMSALFSDLAKVKESLGIVGFGVSYATLDEVFLALSRKLNPGGAEVVPIEDPGEEVFDAIVSQTKRPFYLGCVQFSLLFKKKMAFTFRKKGLVIAQVLLPVAMFIISSIRLGSQVYIDGRSAPSLTISLDGYHHKETRALYLLGVPQYSDSVLQAVLGPTAEKSSQPTLWSELNQQSYHDIRNKHIIGVSIRNRSLHNIRVYYSSYYYHTSPLALNIYANLILKSMDINRGITVKNHPLQHPFFKGPGFIQDPFGPEIFSVSMALGLTVLTGCFIVFPTEERLNQVKHLQMMAGVRATIYWFAIFVWDLIVCFVVILGLLIFSRLHEKTQVLTVPGRVTGTTLGVVSLLLIFSYCSIMMAYTFSHFARSVSGGFALITVMGILFGGILPLFTTTNIPTGLNPSPIGLAFLRLIPSFSLASGLRKYAQMIFINAKCGHFTELGATHYCKWRNGSGIITKYECCLNCAEFAGPKECNDRYELIRAPWKYILGNNVSNSESHMHKRHHKYEHADEGRNIIAEMTNLVVVGLLLNFLAVFLDSDLWFYTEACIFGLRGRAFQTDVEDEDVLDEMERVEDEVSQKMIDKDAVIAHNLCKTYGIFPALHNISFGVHHGECFGILGVNGAGKSTLFQLLTSAIRETFGNVYTVDCSLKSRRKRLMKKMGFAPHTGAALVSYMSPRETINFFSRIRGLSIKAAKQETVDLLRKMDLEQVAKVHCGNLSGGTKRRLSTAVAIIAEPPIVLFDEPTSAADPSSRRLYWEIIKGVKKTGQTVIFNSHRIHECEALCQRVGILVDGKFQCIGSPTHLKDKFGKGFKLMIKLVPGAADNQGYVSSLNDTVVATFNPCTLRDRRRNLVQYVIHEFTTSWDFLFRTMEHIKLRYNDLVEDYSFSETTLEEVFLSFAILQNCGRLPDSANCF